MTIKFKHRLRRLENRLEELSFWIDRAYVDLDGWHFNGIPIALGDFWPTRHGVVTFELDRATVPDDWDLTDTVLDLNLGGEGLVRIDYGGESEEFGLDPHHRRFPLQGRTFSVRSETVARSPFGVPNREARLERARLTWVDRPVERLDRQIRLVYETVKEIGEAHEAASPLLSAAERALGALDWPSATHIYVSRVAGQRDMQRIWELPEGLDAHPAGLDEEQRASVAEASRQLDEELCRLKTIYPKDGNLRITGHAHIDLAWLWPLEETRRKARRTFSTALSLLRRYPEFHFTQSTAQLYAFLDHDDPALFARIQQETRAGRWEPIGGTWVEFDTNMPAGESMVRQLLYGQRYFRQRFGRISDVAWLPDTFGFTPALPQLLRGAGMENFFTIKVTWSETNQFPYDLFEWEGLDGSRVLAHVFDNPDGGYNGHPSPMATINTWRNYRGKYLSRESLLSIGEGDGGGGVTREMLEQMRDQQVFPVLPSLRFGSVREFYHDTRQAISGKTLPVWTGEMYLELHRGTLTTQGRTKFLHRRAERDLVAAEVISALNYLAGGPQPVSLEPHWQILLRNQFHDILPGSSIREVYERTEAELGGVVEAADQTISAGLQMIANRLGPPTGEEALLAVNPDLSARPLRAELSSPYPGAQEVEGGYVLTGEQTIPALGALVIGQVDAAPDLSVSPRHLENSFVRVELDKQGVLTSVWDKRVGREALAGRGNQLWTYVDKPRDFDAWDIDEGYRGEGQEVLDVAALEVIETGPHRVAIRVERRFRHSRIVQEIRLWANSARLEFHTTLDWHDRHWLLKAHFPLNVRANYASFETAFGVIERPTDRNTSWQEAKFEVVGHRFADLSEPGFGVALLNNGKYGHNLSGHEMGISLLRSPAYPDPLADEGLQSFTYALYPHQGDWLEGSVLMEAEDLNRPLLTHPCRAQAGTQWQPIRMEGLPVALGTLKVAEDDAGVVLRAYEPQGASGQVRLILPPGWRCTSQINLLEEPIAEPDFSFSPFQVRSWLLERDR